MEPRHNLSPEKIPTSFLEAQENDEFATAPLPSPFTSLVDTGDIPLYQQAAKETNTAISVFNGPEDAAGAILRSSVYKDTVFGSTIQLGDAEAIREFVITAVKGQGRAVISVVSHEDNGDLGRFWHKYNELKAEQGRQSSS